MGENKRFKLTFEIVIDAKDIDEAFERGRKITWDYSELGILLKGVMEDKKFGG